MKPTKELAYPGKSIIAKVSGFNKDEYTKLLLSSGKGQMNIRAIPEGISIIKKPYFKFDKGTQNVWGISIKSTKITEDVSKFGRFRVAPENLETYGSKVTINKYFTISPSAKRIRVAENAPLSNIVKLKYQYPNYEFVEVPGKGFYSRVIDFQKPIKGPILRTKIKGFTVEVPLEIQSMRNVASVKTAPTIRGIPRVKSQIVSGTTLISPNFDASINRAMSGARKFIVPKVKYISAEKISTLGGDTSQFGFRLGTYDVKRNIVYIRKGMASDVTKETLKHEVAHAYFEQMGRGSTGTIPASEKKAFIDFAKSQNIPPNLMGLKQAKAEYIVEKSMGNIPGLLKDNKAARQAFAAVSAATPLILPQTFYAFKPVERSLAFFGLGGVATGLLKPMEEVRTLTTPNIKVGQMQRPELKLKNELAVPPIEVPVENIFFGTAHGYGNIQVPIPKVTQAELQVPAVRQIQITQTVINPPPISISPIMTPPVAPTTRLPKVPPFVFAFEDYYRKKKRKPISRKLNVAYVPEVRRYGKFKPISPPVSKSRALQIGAKATTTTLAATFRIKPVLTKSTPQEQTGFTLNKRIFRPSRSRKEMPFTFVQRKTQRLKAPTEIKEILSIRRTKRGGFL